MSTVTSVAAVIAVVGLLACVCILARTLDESSYQRRQRVVVERWALAVMRAESGQAVLELAHPGDAAIAEVTTTCRIDIAAARYREATAEQRTDELCGQLSDRSPTVRLAALVAVIMEDADIYGPPPQITSPEKLRVKYERTLSAVLGLCGRGDVQACESYAALVRGLYGEYGEERVFERFDMYKLEPLPSPELQ